MRRTLSLVMGCAESKRSKALPPENDECLSQKYAFVAEPTPRSTPPAPPVQAGSQRCSLGPIPIGAAPTAVPRLGINGQYSTASAVRASRNAPTGAEGAAPSEFRQASGPAAMKRRSSPRKSKVEVSTPITSPSSSQPDSPSSLQATSLHGSWSRVDAALKEIVATESAYVHAIRTLVKRYKEPMQPLLGDADASKVFGKCEVILGVNEALLQQLQATLAPQAQRQEASLSEQAAVVAKAFLTMVPFLRSYAIYCSGYYAALERLTKLQSERPSLALEIRRLEALVARDEDAASGATASGATASGATATTDLRLSPCLIKPVQRLCRYPLLLEALLHALKSATPADGPARPSVELLSQATDKVRKMADNVNNMVRDAESRLKMLEIQSRLRNSADLISPSRRFISEATTYVGLRSRQSGLLLPSEGDSFLNEAKKEAKMWAFSDLLLFAQPERTAPVVRQLDWLPTKMGPTHVPPLGLPFYQIVLELPLDSLVIEWSTLSDDSLERADALPRRGGLGGQTPHLALASLMLRSSHVSRAASERDEETDRSLEGVHGPTVSFWLHSPTLSVHVAFENVPAALQMHNAISEAKCRLKELQSTMAFERRTQMAEEGTDASPPTGYQSLPIVAVKSSWRVAKKNVVAAQQLSWPSASLGRSRSRSTIGTLTRTLSGLKMPRTASRNSALDEHSAASPVRSERSLGASETSDRSAGEASQTRSSFAALAGGGEDSAGRKANGTLRRVSQGRSSEEEPLATRGDAEELAPVEASGGPQAQAVPPAEMPVDAADADAAVFKRRPATLNRTLSDSESIAFHAVQVVTARGSHDPPRKLEARPDR